MSAIERPGTVSFFLFGRLRANAGGGPRPILASKRTVALLGFLLLRLGEVVTRREVAQALAPDATDAEALASLRRRIYELDVALRKNGLDRVVVRRSATTLSIDCDGAILTDVAEFTRAARDQHTLETAAALYTDDVLANLDDEWIEKPRAALRERRSTVLERLITACEGAGDYACVLKWAKVLAASDPYREDAVRAIMRARVALGDLAGARHAFHSFAAALRADLATEPSATTLQAYEAITEPSASARPALSFPPETNSFVGRESDLAQLEAAFAESRLVNIVGPPGVGKTRLAVRFATSTASFGYAYFVDVAKVARAEELEGFLAAGLRAALAFSTAAAGPGARTLLVVDNCEAFAEAAGAWALEALRQFPALAILATSRIAFDTSAEHVVRLRPLAVPEPALRLLTDRVRAAGVAFASTPAMLAGLTRICRRFDGLPLALELAAMRLRTESLAAIERESAGPATLAQAFARSYGLLDEGDRAAFRHAGIFRSTISEEALATVLDCDVDAARGALARLAHRSLLEGPPLDEPLRRYRILDSARGFAFERLAASGELDGARLRHARYFGRRYAERIAEIRAIDRTAWQHEVEVDRGNIADALDVLLASGNDAALGAQATIALSYLYATGRMLDVPSLLRTIVANATLSGDVRAQATLRLAICAREEQPPETTLALAIAAEETLRTSDPDAAARALLVAAEAERLLGRYASARERYERAAHTFRELANPYLAAYGEVGIGLVLQRLGGLDAADATFRDALDTFQSLGAAGDVGLTLVNLATSAIYRGDADGALRLCAEARRRAGLAADRHAVTRARIVEARASIAAGDTDAALPILEELSGRVRAERDAEAGTFVLETGVVLCARAGRRAEALRLAGALDAARRRLGFAAVAADRDAQRVVAELHGPDGGGREPDYLAGRALELDEALAQVGNLREATRTAAARRTSTI